MFYTCRPSERLLNTLQRLNYDISKKMPEELDRKRDSAKCFYLVRNRDEHPKKLENSYVRQ